jgi:hypothetical protein
MERKMKREIRIKSKDLAVTAEGVVLQGEAASVVAALLDQGDSVLLKVTQHLDPKLKTTDIRVDDSGRVVLQSARLEKMVFESLRNGGSLRNPRVLGRLVARTGGRIGKLSGGASDESPLDEKSAIPEDSVSEDTDQKLPPIRGESNGVEDEIQIDFACRGEDGLDLVCGSWNDPDSRDPHRDVDVDCYCGWGDY